MKKLMMTLAILVMGLSFGGCRNGEAKKIVTDVVVETFDNDQYEKVARVSFQMDLDQAQLPAALYDLPDGLGSVELRYTLENKNYVDLQVNITRATRLEPGEATLPNGGTLPVYSADGVIEIPIPQIKGSVYLATNMERTLIGYGMAISALDGIGNKLGRVGLFPRFSIKMVDISAGLFTDPEPDNTGFAAFITVNWGFGDEERDGTIYLRNYKYRKRFLKYVDYVYRTYYQNKRMILEPAPRN